MNLIAAIDESAVLDDPDTARSTAALWSRQGYSVMCVTRSHYEECHAVLGSRVEYVTDDAWLDGALRVGR